MQLFHAPEKLARLCSVVFPKPIPGSRQIRSAATPATQQHITPLSKVGLHLKDHVLIRGVRLHGGGRPLLVHNADTDLRFDDDSEHLRDQPSIAVTSLTISAPASMAAWATIALLVSIERGTVAT